MTPRPLLIRADASAAIGAGHVMRTLALAQEWRARGGAVTYLVADPPRAEEAFPTALRERLLREGCEVYNLSSVCRSGSEEDARDTAEAAHRLGCEWVVLDGYRFDDIYEGRLAARGLKILALDDYAHATHAHADMVLNQNAHAAATMYPGRGAHTRLLLGLEYALLRDEFLAARERLAREPRDTSGRRARLLVTFGGADPGRLTLRAAEAIASLAEETAPECVMVVGGANPPGYEDEVARALAGRGTVLRNVSDMADRLAWADVALTAGGSTTIEALSLDVRLLVVVTAENQRAHVEALARCGRCVALGDDAWRAAIERVAARPSERGAPAPAAATVGGRAVVLEALCAASTREKAGAGGPRAEDRTQRAAEGRHGGRSASEDGRAAKASVSLRPMCEEDQDRLRVWRNLPEVRMYMNSDHEISEEEHIAWFQRSLVSPAVRYWIIELDGEGVGLAGVTGIDVRHRRCSWAFYLADPQLRGRGVGSVVEWHVIETVFGKLGLHKLCGEVLATNQRVLDMHRGFGFKTEGRLREQILKGGAWVDLVVIGLLADEWQAQRPIVEKRLRDRGLL